MMGLTSKMAVAGLVLGASASVTHNAVTPAAGNGTVVYTTEVVTALTTYCPEATTLTHGDKTYTITSATTLTITDCPCTITKPAKPTATAPAGDACANSCYDAYNKCRTGGDANMASCAAAYASCLGYSPFGDDGSLVTPTACSKKAVATTPSKVYYTTEVVTALTTYCPEATTMTFNNKTITVSKPTTLTITDCPCTIKKPSPSSPASGSNCASDCSTAYNTCRGKSGANMATCAAEYAQCLGYNPYGTDGSLITPSACSPGAPGTTAPSKPTGTSPSSGNKITTPGQPIVPTGTSPSSPNQATTTPKTSVVVGGAAQIAPAGLAIALGALALL